MTNVLAQTAFRVRTDATAAQGGTPVWAAAQSVNAVIKAGNPFRIRFVFANTGTTAVGALNATTIYSSKNGAAYKLVQPSGKDISCVDATNGISPDGQSLVTSLLTSGLTFDGGNYFLQGGGYGVVENAGGYCEFEFGLEFTSPACDGNTYTFQMYFNAAPLNSYTATPSFVMANHAALAATEANDAITAAGNVPRAALLNILEVGDALTGSATALWPTGILAITEADDSLSGTAIATPILGALAATEADDSLHGSCFAVPAGGAVANLRAIEAGDVLAGTGTGSGDVGSLSTQEADDSLVGAAMPIVGAILNAAEDDDSLTSTTLLWADQWVEDTGCVNQGWIQVTNPAEPIVFPPITPPTPPITPPSTGTEDMLQMEQLTVLGVNSLSAFSHPPNMDLCQLTIDGHPFFPVGSAPDFLVAGTSVTWLNPSYSVVPGSTVIASYSWTQ